MLYTKVFSLFFALNKWYTKSVFFSVNGAAVVKQMTNMIATICCFSRPNCDNMWMNY